MSRLEELEKELYGEEEEGRRKRLRRRILFPKSLHKPPTAWLEGVKPPLAKKFFPGDKKIRKYFWGGLAAVLSATLAVFIFIWLGTRGDEAEVTIQERGPIEAGEVLTLPVTFKNLSGTTLQDVELALILPPGSLILEGNFERPAPPRITERLDDLRPREEKTVEFSVRLFGQEQEEKTVEAVLSYRPENLRARFSARTSRALRISRVPLGISWELPEELSRGQEVRAKVHYTSVSSRPFRNIWLRLEYPSGFEFSGSDPKPEVGNTIWALGDLDPGAEGVINILGKITGEEGETKTFFAELGVFNTLTKEWKGWREESFSSRLAVTPLSVQAFLGGERSGFITPGDRLDFRLRYKNNTHLALKNVSLSSTLEGKMVDLGSLSIDEGVFDSASRSIRWGPGTKSELSELAPGEEGEVSFSVNTRVRPVFLGAGDKNQTVVLGAEIRPALVPRELAGRELVSRDSLTFKVRSEIVFSARALYRSSPILNSGPLPPRVDQKTTYTIFWEVRNFTNDLREVEVKTAIPPNINWESAVFPEDARIIFDQGSGEVKWRLGEVKAGTGVVSPALVGAFKVSVSPSEADLGKMISLTGESRLSGADTFTGENIEERAQELSTVLDESSADLSEGTVVR